MRGSGVRRQRLQMAHQAETFNRRRVQALAIQTSAPHHHRGTQVSFSACPVPLLYAHTLQDQVSGKLDLAAFPYVKDYPQVAPAASSTRPTPTLTTSLRSAKLNWHCVARTGGAVSETCQWVLVFVAGGMTYSERHEAYILSSQLQKDVIIGACTSQQHNKRCW